MGEANSFYFICLNLTLTRDFARRFELFSIKKSNQRTNQRWATRKKARKFSFKDALSATPWRAAENTKRDLISTGCGDERPAAPPDLVTPTRIRKKASNGAQRLWMCT